MNRLPLLLAAVLFFNASGVEINLNSCTIPFLASSILIEFIGIGLMCYGVRRYRHLERGSTPETQALLAEGKVEGSLDKLKKATLPLSLVLIFFGPIVFMLNESFCKKYL